MKTARFIQMGRLGVVLGLCVACEGKMRSLGDLEAGGTAGSSAQGKGGDGSSGASATGSGVAGSGIAGSGVAGSGVAGSGVAGSGVSYVQNPTLPLDPTCTCSSPDQICDAARECVPRCDSAGRCATWLSPVAIKNLYVEGSNVYFLTFMAYDPLGNPLDGGSLYRAEYPNGAPTLVASGIRDPEIILGRHNGATFVATANTSTADIIQISDAGALTTIASDIDYYSGVSMRRNLLVYTDASRMKLLGIDLDGDSVPQLLMDSTTANLGIDQSYGIGSVQVLDDSLWFAAQSSSAFQYRFCYLNRENLGLGPICNDVSDFFRLGIHSTNGRILFYSTGMEHTKVESMDVTGKHLLTLFSGEAGPYGGATIGQARYLDGWLYSLAWGSMQLVRYPTTVGRLPQAVLPENVALPAFAPETPRSSTGDFAVGPVGLFWFQCALALNQPQYIFHASLPPQPCDAELPCANSDQRCIDGSCRIME